MARGERFGRTGSVGSLAMSAYEGEIAGNDVPGPFFFFERTDIDFPFYRGAPTRVGLVGWSVVLAAVAVAYLVLLATQQRFHVGIGGFIPPLLFVGIPLLALAVVAGSGAVRALFLPFRLSDAPIILGFLVLNWIVTVALGSLAVTLFNASPNPAGQMVADAAGLDKFLFFLWTAVQLVGEEIFTILPFLAFLTILDRRIGRKGAIALAALGASIIFALIHLPAYQWNVPHVLFAIVPIRLVLLMPYLVTRNLGVSAAVHILNDWSIFGLGVIADLTASGEGV
jgi:hypothetical protein